MPSDVNDNYHLKRSIKLAWASGSLANVMMGNVINYLAYPIYVIGLGVSPVFLGWAMGIPRIWDAITDPVMGHISDNTRSRWGRRRPYILIGAILSGVVFALLWMPPVKSGVTFIGYYLFVTTIFFYSGGRRSFARNIMVAFIKNRQRRCYKGRTDCRIDIRGLCNNYCGDTGLILQTANKCGKSGKNLFHKSNQRNI